MLEVGAQAAVDLSAQVDERRQLSGAERAAICPHCQLAFRRYRQRQKFCSDVCARRSRSGRPLLAARRGTQTRCPTCGAQFLVGGRFGKTLGTRFCSRMCARIAEARATPPARLTATEAAYLAAFLDGEGSIFPNKSGGRSWRISIVQKDEAVIRWLREVTQAGSIHRRRNLGSGLRRPRQYADLFCWQVSGWDAADLVRQIHPYLHVKRMRAEQMLAAYAVPMATQAGVLPETGLLQTSETVDGHHRGLSQPPDDAVWSPTEGT